MGAGEMKVLHITNVYGTKYTGGAAISATRLHNCLLDAGVESHVLCMTKAEEGRNVIEAPPRGSFARWMHLHLAKVERNIWRFTPYRRKIDLNAIPLGVKRIVRTIVPDLIQVHNISTGMLRFEELTGLGTPIVLTQHDLWKINGFDPCPYSDTRLFDGFDRGNSTWLERWLWRRKYRLCREPNVTFAAPSKWAAEVTRRSLCGKDKEVDIIPNLIGTEFGYFPEKRKRHEKFRILFGCNCGRHNEFKGFDDLEQALQRLPDAIQRNTELYVFGDRSSDFKIGGIDVKMCGILNTAEELVDAYHAADVLAFPSKTETQGMVKIESLMCGLPVIVFNRTACPEAVEHGKNGWIAGAGDIQDYANGIVHFYNEWAGGDLESKRRAIADGAAGEYGNEAIMETVIKVYRRLTGRKRTDAR